MCKKNDKKFELIVSLFNKLICIFVSNKKQVYYLKQNNIK